MKKKFTMKSLIGNLLFVSVLFLIITRFLTIWSGTAFPVNLISANSMNPTLMEGDIVAWVPADINDVKVGDVIVFRSWLSWPEEKFVVHRVVEIQEAWGNPALVTKGDANEYTDQAGPHIVEPYITSKNLIGKTISLGQQPLKIPLIGLIGIWINEGFKALAQPSEAKESITYIGVFTPMTISVILFIIVLVLIPEKTKTLREKLRLLILGSHTLDVKKTFVSFLIMYLVLLPTIHVFAYDTTTASFAIGEFADESDFELGSVSPGSTSHPRDLPVYNPGVMPVKGFIMGSGQLAQYADWTMFDVGPAGSKMVPITATAPETATRGAYNGNLLMYSSPLWYMIPDEIINHLCIMKIETAPFLLDLLAGTLLTVLTICCILIAQFITDKYTAFHIDLSWQYAPARYARKGIFYMTRRAKKNITLVIKERFGWITQINLLKIDLKKPILASFLIIPMFLLIGSELLAAVLATVCAGVAAYFISCKLRKKIVLASVISLTAALSYIIIKTNYALISSHQYSIIESVSLGLGLTGIYLLVLAIFLIPLSLTAWYITRVIRNLKEQQEPLLILEGSCDL